MEDMMAKRKTVRRDWLKKMVEAGKVEAKCNHVYTDDYAFDNAYNFGKTGWMPARVSHPTWEEYTNSVGNVCHRASDSDMKSDCLNFHDHDFTFSTGGASWNDDKTEINFYPLSSESYTLRMIA